MYCTYKHKYEARSHNHCCRRKAICITHSECESVKRMCRIVICGLSGSTILF